MLLHFVSLLYACSHATAVCEKEYDWVRGWKGGAAGWDTNPKKNTVQMFRTTRPGRTVKEQCSVWMLYKVMGFDENCVAVNITTAIEGDCAYIGSHWCSIVAMLKEKSRVFFIVGSNSSKWLSRYDLEFGAAVSTRPRTLREPTTQQKMCVIIPV